MSDQPKPITERTRAELKEGYREALRNYPQVLEPKDYQGEYERRTNVWFTRALTGMTGGLVALAVVQADVTIHPPTTSSPQVASIPTPTPASPAFTAGTASYYCPAPPGACTITDIFRSTGGSGSEVITFTATYTKDGQSQTKTCQAVVPTTTQGSYVQASCSVNYPLPASTMLSPPS
jgi:hypothetical protein